MLTRRQYQILNVCADRWEVFLQLYLATGSRVHRSPAPEANGSSLVSDVCDLVQAGLLSGRNVTADDRRAARGRVTMSDMVMYRVYSCGTLAEHVTQFGRGPHEFRATHRGVRELGHPRYRAYDRVLGW